MTDPHLPQRARAFALERHGDQRYAGQPYAYHFDRVAWKRAQHGGLSPQDQAEAYLHDVLEDTPTTREEMEAMFGPEVTENVFCVSGFGHNRKTRNADIYAKCEGKPKPCELKSADRLVNHLTSICSPDTGQPDLGKIMMYLKEKEVFMTRIGAYAPESMRLELLGTYAQMQEIIDERTRVLTEEAVAG